MKYNISKVLLLVTKYIWEVILEMKQRTIFPPSIAICVLILYVNKAIAFTSAKRERADSFGVAVSQPSKQQKIAAVAAVTTSCQVSQANVGRLINGLL